MDNPDGVSGRGVRLGMATDPDADLRPALREFRENRHLEE